MRRMYKKPTMQLRRIQSTGMLALTGAGVGNGADDVNIGNGGNASENGNRPVDARSFDWNAWDDSDAGW